MVELTRRNLMATSVAAALGASVSGVASAQSDEDRDTSRAPSVKGEIERFASTALGAEVTGQFMTQAGTLFFSLQHPSRMNPAPFNSGGIGYVSGYNFYENDGFDELSVPNTNEEQSKVRVANGEYVLLAQEGDNIANNEDLGMPVTPEGFSVDNFAGTRYANLGYTPDMNQFVPTNDEGTEGLLFTNFETSPGMITRMPISQDDDGEWQADLENTINLANTEAFRDVGGTRINCYGDLSPWNTAISSEEDYNHTRLSYTATTSQIVEEGSGVGLIGAAQFFNRPNPATVGDSEWYGEYNDGVYPQGAFALSGVELHAYYLGADPVDQDDGENTTTPIGEGYPNQYRTGYNVDLREPDSETPQPVKYYVMGRSAWEAPDAQEDQKTVYLSTDGSNKGFYKFVADEEIPSYDDPMALTGTLYVAEVTNEDAGKGKPPASTELELDWIPLGSASNAEVESWIAEYDDTTQVDYLESHADTDWEEDLEAALKEADEEVVANGNQDYVSNEEILAWAEQHEENGPDGVDEELRRIPFIETRAAAKEVGGTVEFRKSEGIDSVEGAEPGDYVYLGLSEVNDGMANEEGDLQLDRVDGGMVYRAELEAEYDISTLEPVIVGPDGTDPADVADGAVVNVDGIFVLNDGRVICSEDADQYGRSYPNDCMYIYTPDDSGHSLADK